MRMARSLTDSSASDCHTGHPYCSIGRITDPNDLAFVYIIKKFITVEVILSLKASYRTEMVTDVVVCKS